MKSAMMLLMLIASAAPRLVGAASCFTSGCGPTGHFVVNYVSSTSITSPAGTTLPNWGSSIAQIPEMFAYTQLVNFEGSTTLNAMFSGMDSSMLARWTTELAANDHSNYTPTILEYAAKQLSAANLVRLASAMGPTKVASALSYAPAAVAAQYRQLPAAPALEFSEYWFELGNTTTFNFGDLYVYDLLLDAYTQGAGGTSTPYVVMAGRYLQATRTTKASVVEILTGVAAALAIFDSSTAQQVNNWLEQNVEFIDGFPVPIITIPSIEIPSVLPPDWTVPFVVAYDNDAGTCVDGSCDEEQD